MDETAALAMLQKYIEEQRGVADQQKLLATQAQKLPVQTDLSPLMGLVDSWGGGTNLRGSYKAPESPQERLETVSRLQKAAANTEDDITDAITSRLNMADKLQTSRLNRKLASEESRDRKIGDVTLKVVKPKMEQELRKAKEKGIAFDQLDSLIDAMKRGNTVAFPAIGVSMAKAMGEVGVLTDKDVTRYARSSKLLQNAYDKVLLWSKGQVSPATAGELKDIVKIMKKATQTFHRKTWDNWAGTLGANTGISLDEAYDRLQIPRPGEEEWAGEDKMTYQRFQELLNNPKNKRSEADLRKALTNKGIDVEEAPKQEAK